MSLKRVEIELEPGMRARLYYLAPGGDKLATAQNLILRQLNLMRGWHPKSPGIWDFTPATQRARAINASNASQRELAPEMASHSDLGWVISQLAISCRNITAPLVGIDALDTLIRDSANRVSEELIPGALGCQGGMIKAMASTANITYDQFVEHYNATLDVRCAVRVQRFDDAKNFLPAAAAFLMDIGMIAPHSAVPKEVGWLLRSNQSRVGFIHVPFPDAAHRRLAELEQATGLGKEALCRHLLVAALADVSPRFHIERQVEAEIMQRKFVQVCRMECVIKNYQCKLQAVDDIPDADPGLAPFSRQLAERFENATYRFLTARRVLTGGILARRDDECYAKLVERVNEARWLGHTITVEQKHTEEVCHRMHAMLHRIGY